jgi:hypothetical protein
MTSRAVAGLRQGCVMVAPRARQRGVKEGAKCVCPIYFHLFLHQFRIRLGVCTSYDEGRVRINGDLPKIGSWGIEKRTQVQLSA